MLFSIHIVIAVVSIAFNPLEITSIYVMESNLTAFGFCFGSEFETGFCFGSDSEKKRKL